MMSESEVTLGNGQVRVVRWLRGDKTLRIVLAPAEDDGPDSDE